MNEALENKKVNVIAIILTIIISIGFAWAIWQLSGLHSKQETLARSGIQANELAAFRYLKRIAAAQEEYKDKDWDGDGRKVYAMFYVHLWKSVTAQGEPIAVGLIPKRLGFAMDNSNPLGGYYFMDLRKRVLENRIRRDFDYGREWGAAAIPGTRGRSGVLTFVIDQSRAIYATSTFHIEPEYPFAPERNGWTKISTIKELKDFQKKVNYPVE
ncbi:MAG: DUF2950 family protein [Candidatus Aminicenantes bacterium]|nr:DUF2950 family protein [Candidatus Aminicenantes bacterium]